MVLNMRLRAGLAGIVAVGKIGEVLLHGTFRVGHGARGRTRIEGVIWLVLPGLTLMLLGYIGLFLGRLIKAAISRQREFLADASAVQFTCYPDGIANALIKIRNGGSTRLVSRHAEDMSHMCFGESMKFLRLGGLLATHPPWKSVCAPSARNGPPGPGAGNAPARAPAPSSAIHPLRSHSEPRNR